MSLPVQRPTVCEENAAISDMEKLMAARQQNKEQERSSTKKSVLDALHSLKAKKQEQPAQEQDKPKKAKTKGMEL